MIGKPDTSFFDKLLADLKASLPLDGYQLSIYCHERNIELPQPCCTFNDSLCGSTFAAHLPRVFDRVATDGKPTMFRCPAGLLGFAVGLRRNADRLHLLVGTGVREQTLDLFSIENFARPGETNLFELLEYLQALPIASPQEVQLLAERVHAVAAAILTAAEPAKKSPDTSDRLKLIATISASLDQAATPPAVFSLLQETIGLMFDVPAMVTVIPDQDNGNYQLVGGWGQLSLSGPINPQQLARLFLQHVPSRLILRDEALRELFPQTQARFANCQSLADAHGPFGIICSFNKEFTPDDLLLIELLSGRATQRLIMLRQEEEFARKSSLANRFLTMIASLGGIEEQNQYDHILQMASELTDASCGSLMLLDKDRELLQIRSSIGLSPHLTKAMSIRLGTGIAGKVAASGEPLLVNNIELDERVATPNRPRFKTKSFISLPLITRVRVSGVLNLSDKRNQGIFTNADLELLTPFVSHIAAMMQKNLVLEQVAMLERLSITDPLTELYNRRYLERRMEEEINRSMRNGSTLTIMMIDLDYFKVYNDLHGHIAGDKALVKVAKVLSASVRDMDVVTRYGGEEFCVLLPGAAKREAAYVANRIRRDIENELFHGEEQLPGGRLTTSIGVSSFPGDGITATAVINAADIALYEAKSAGRNRITIYSGRRPNEQPSAPSHYPQLT